MPHFLSESTIPTRAARLTLAVAGIGVTLTCNDIVLAQRLRERYRPFLTAGPTSLTAHVHVQGRLRTSARLDTGTVFRSGVLHFTAPGYQGTVDVEAGQAQLHLSSASPLEDVEYFLRVIYALLAFRFGGLLFHAAGIVRRGRAYLFFGPSGSGKTTVARLSADSVVLNDDLVLLTPRGRHWVVHATPFWSPSQVQPTGPRSASVVAMFRLVQDQTMHLEAMDLAPALAELIANVPVLPSDPTRSHRLLGLGQRLLRSVPVYRLQFRPDPSFWHVVEAQSADSEP